MSKVWDTYISRATLAFTLTTIFAAFYDFLNDKIQIDYLFIFVSLGFIVLLEIIDYFLSKLTLKSRMAYHFTEFSTMYICFLAFAYWGNWFRFSFGNITIFSIIFLLIFLLMHLYYYIVLRTDAAAINQKLMQKNSNERG